MLDIVSVKDIVIMSIGSLIALIYVLLLVAGKGYNDILEPLSGKEFPLCETYNVGLKIINRFPALLKSEKARKNRQYIDILYGEQYSEYYNGISKARTLSITALVAVGTFILYGFSGDVTILVVMAFMTGIAYYYFDTIDKKNVQRRTEEISLEFANVVSKLALLINAGMIIREAWELVAYSGDSYLYQEMQIVVEQINNGESEEEAYSRFAMRCISSDVKKFTSTLIQGMSKGNSELTEMLKVQNREIWDRRQALVKTQAEKAGSKLLLPMSVMFVGILIMIIVPIFSNIG